MRAHPCLVMAICVALCGSAAGHAPPARNAARVDRHRVEAGDWQLLTARDHFSGEATCWLRASNDEAFVVGGAVAFAFPKSWNTHAAIYRIGGDATRQWRDDLPELLRLGTPMDRGSVENPAQGLVWLPLRRLDEVTSVEIAPQPGRPPRRFNFRGLKGLYQTALSQGCTPASRLVK